MEGESKLTVERVDSDRVKVTTTTGNRTSTVTVRVLDEAAADRVRRNEEAHRDKIAELSSYGHSNESYVSTGTSG